jgi:transglutaminase-like putative cysteine protease
VGVVTYRVVHRTHYQYDSPVSASYGVAHLHPRETPRQQTYSSTLTIDPFPEHYRERRDFFGNRAAHFTVLEPHRDLTVTATSLVDVRDGPGLSEALGDLRWEQARDRLHADTSAETLEARQFVLASPAATPSVAAVEYARPTFRPERLLAESLEELCGRLHTEFEFAPGSTTISTPVDEVVARRAGVCQDFAHLTISALRGLGLAARYVSGYLETDPPPGQDRLVGADVSHAWVSVFVPEVGWVDIDPTNGQFVNHRYVTVAWGRDYADVPPLKGVIYTESEGQKLEVTVDVTTVPDDDPALASVAS